MEISVDKILDSWVTGCIEIGNTNCDGCRHTYFETVDIEGNRVTQPKEMEVAINKMRMVLKFKNENGQFGRLEIYDLYDKNKWQFYYFSSENEKNLFKLIYDKTNKQTYNF